MKRSRAFLKIFFMISILPCSCQPGRLVDNPLIRLASPTVPDCSLDSIRNSITPNINPSPFPTADKTNIAWSKYQNQDYGFSFEYPTIFEGTSDPACYPRGVQGSGLSLYVGSSAAIYIWKLQDPTWQDYACRLLMINQDVWNYETLDDVQLDGVEALVAKYHDEQGNPGITIFSGLDQYTLTISLVNNPSCTEALDEIDELTIFYHVVDSFRFSK